MVPLEGTMASQNLCLQCLWDAFALYIQFIFGIQSLLWYLISKVVGLAGNLTVKQLGESSQISK